jgi:hypothetical protein
MKTDERFTMKNTMKKKPGHHHSPPLITFIAGIRGFADHCGPSGS